MISGSTLTTTMMSSHVPGEIEFKFISTGINFPVERNRRVEKIVLFLPSLEVNFVKAIDHIDFKPCLGPRCLGSLV